MATPMTAEPQQRVCSELAMADETCMRPVVAPLPAPAGPVSEVPQRLRGRWHLVACPDGTKRLKMCWDMVRFARLG